LARGSLIESRCAILPGRRVYREGDMDVAYPLGPSMVPADLTKPSPAYVRHARLAMAGLLLFLALYLGLLGWFSWTAYRLLAQGGGSLLTIAWGIANAFFAVFLIKALLFIKRAKPPTALEIDAKEEPQLFGFIARLVADAGAPTPHRVFLSHDVNAAVFYDLSFINLIWPSRKNLVIGVGLINVLALGEFKAVLAHEFGHFAQRSMAVGRWVYMSQQIARQIVDRRDVLDRALIFLSNIDLRLAWIGWLLRLVVWSLRSTIEIALRVVVVAERALSREMEFQADLVAVSLTGSDALIHALHRLGAADEAMNEAIGGAAQQLGEGRAVRDVYELQTRAIERMRAIIDDESYGTSPRIPAGERERHRVFEHERVMPPKMWATHPSNRAREDNAKSRYVACEIDERPAWVLFRDPGATRRKMTAHLLKAMGAELKQLETLDDARGVAVIERRFGRKWFEPRYRGVYLGRSCVREASRVSELFDPNQTSEIDFAKLYPESLRSHLGQWKDSLVERATLEGLRDGRLHSPDGVIRHRGQPIRAREIPAALEQVAADCQRARATLAAHDRACRSVHWAAAREVGEDWAGYYYSLVALLHYADHSEANLRDAQRHLGNVLAVVTADDRVTEAERARVIQSAEDLHWSLRAIHQHAREVVLPEVVAREFGGKSWTELIGDPYPLPPPDANNLGDWLGVIDGWLHAVLDPLDGLERQCLQAMLEVEAEIEACIREGRTLGPAPALAQGPSEYRVLPPGQEREVQTKLPLWERFYVADGLFPSIARTVIALAIVGATLYGGLYVGG
jgi:Zn-dependent protease with chaperone function